MYFEGKTHTMLGTDEDPGLIFLAIHQLFEKQNVSTDRDFSIRYVFLDNNCHDSILICIFQRGLH